MEGARLPGPHIEQSAHLRMVQQPEHHVHAVSHPHEVPELPAVPVVGMVGLEQLHRFIHLHLGENVGHHALLPPLVVFIGAVHVEKLEPGVLGGNRPPFLHLPGHLAVKQGLAPAVRVQGAQGIDVLQGGVIVKPHGAVPVRGRRRGVNKLLAVQGAELPQAPAQREIRPDDQIGVRLRGGGNGPHVNDGLNFLRMRLHVVKHVLRRNHGAQLSLGDVFPLVGRAQLIHHHKILFTGFFQSGDNV